MAQLIVEVMFVRTKFLMYRIEHVLALLLGGGKLFVYVYFI